MSTTQPTRHTAEVIEAARKLHSTTGEELRVALEALAGRPNLDPYPAHKRDWDMSAWLYQAYFRASLVLADALACAEADRDELSAADRRCLQIEARMADCEECNRQLYSELAEARKENARLRTLWTEARVVVAEGRDANCLVSYGATQVEAVEMANAWLDKMQAPSVDEEIARQANDGTLNATIDAASEAGKNEDKQ